MIIKRIDEARFWQKLRAGEPVYILKSVNKYDSIGMLLDVEVFIEVVEDTPRPETKTPEVTTDVELDTLRKLVKESRKREEQAPVPKEVAEQSEAPAQKRGRGRPSSIDKGKVMSLYRAGWALEAIAKEVDASVPTILAITMQEDL